MVSPETTIKSALTGAVATDGCPFLNRIPLDIRLMVYQYLVGRHVKQELDMNSKEYNDQRQSILRGPDFTYSFHLSILGVNKQVRAEALDLHLNQNTFISLTYDASYGNNWLDYGAAVIARGDRARTFPSVGMYVDFNTGHLPCLSASGEIQKQTVCVLPIDVLSSACVRLQRKIRSNPTELSIRITIPPSIGDYSVTSEGGSLVPCSQLRKCLDIMSQIRGAGRVEIYGPVNDSYRAATIAAMCSRHLSLKETMALVGAQIDQGDKALAKGKHESAIAEYRAAFHRLRRTHFLLISEDELNQTLTCGRFRGASVGSAMKNTKVRLHTLMANAYLRSGHYRLARVYVERVYRPLAGADHHFNLQKFPLQLRKYLDAAEPWVYAELLLTAAKISIHHGRDGDADEELVEASYLDPSNTEVLQLREEICTREQRRYEHFAAEYDRHERTIEKKFQDALQVLNCRRAKGDEAFSANNFVLAHRYLEAAYASVRKINSTVWNGGNDGHYHYSSPNRSVSPNLVTEVLTKLTIASLELNDFDQVHRWAVEIFDLEPTFLEAYTNDWWKDSVAWAREANYAANYCRAVALQKQGKIDDAIRYFQAALVCDSACHASYYQLDALRQTKAQEGPKHGTDGV